MGGSSPFLIEADEVQRLCKETGLSEMQYLATLVKPTQLLARVPISRLCVGAVGLGASGRIFKGVNLEFEGLPLNHSVHAEQFLVANAAQHGRPSLDSLQSQRPHVGIAGNFCKCPSGIALMTTKGDICTGFYIESAAFNPSLSPLQTGIIAFLWQDGKKYEDIVHAVLV